MIATTLMRFLPYILGIIAIFGGYKYVTYLQDEIVTLEGNITTLKNTIKTKDDKCKEDLAIEKANVKIKEVIKYKTRYIKRVVKDEKPTNDKFMLNTNTVQ